jgi:hypothetical protein
MSYDLYFTKPRISIDQFDSHFAGNPLYKLTSGEAFYRNIETGVYFIFRYASSNSADDEETACAATFNLHYYRPHYFALEAVSEVTRFVERFNFSIHDSQMEGMDDGPYSPGGFVRGWNYGNEFGYSAILRGEERPHQVWSLPTRRLESIWRWNYLRKKHQEALSDDVFVPRIFFMIIEGAVAAVAVWPDAISELVPEVDFLFVGRAKLAPKNLFRSQMKDECIIPFAEARGVLAQYRTDEYSMPAYRLPSPETPRTVREFVCSLRPSRVSMTGIAADEVLNQELVERVGRV